MKRPLYHMRYNHVKRRTFEILQPTNGKDTASTAFDWFLIVVIVLNIALVAAETFDGISDRMLRVFYYIEVFSVVIFTVEYLLRLWTATRLYPQRTSARARIKYIFSFMAIVDLLAVMPFYLPFLLPVDLRVLRMFRLLRLSRLLKMNRYTSAISSIGSVLKRKGAQLLSSMLVVAMLMIMASFLMYGIEGAAQPDKFTNAFSGLWWAFATLTTVGYGDVYPVTVAGQVLAVVIAMLGIGLVAVPTGIISAGFMENVEHSDEAEQDKKHYCPFCGKNID